MVSDYLHKGQKPRSPIAFWNFFILIVIRLINQMSKAICYCRPRQLNERSAWHAGDLISRLVTRLISKPFYKRREQRTGNFSSLRKMKKNLANPKTSFSLEFALFSRQCLWLGLHTWSASPCGAFVVVAFIRRNYCRFRTKRRHISEAIYSRQRAPIDEQ